MKLFDNKIGKDMVNHARNIVGKHFGVAYASRHRACCTADCMSACAEKARPNLGKHGVFVTLYKYPSLRLRGCIGFLDGTYPLNKAVVEAAKAAAFEDPRFKHLERDEFGGTIFEVSILTEPELITSDKAGKIQIGVDGIIVEANGLRGVLLPKVAVEQKWGAKDFLKHTCLKAGLLEDA